VKNEKLSLKSRLAASTPMLGTFVKTPHYHITEVLSQTELDVLCLDAEHASFTRADLDACVLAARANQQDVIIRVPDAQPATLLNALDIGATGVLVPHVKSAQQLSDIVRQCFYGDEGRGYAGSTRFAGYTTQSLADNLQRNREQTCVMAQIEDLAALQELDEICRVDGVDCLFIGTMDLTVALGATSAADSRVTEVLEQIVSAATKHQRPVGMFIPNLDDLPYWIERGVSLFLLGSDQSFILQGAAALRKKFEASNSQ